MHSIDIYLNKAIETNGLNGDRDLCRKLECSSSVVTGWRKGRSYPSNELMLKLANLIDLNQEVALVELQYWRAASKDEVKTANVFRKLAKHLSKTIHTLCLAGLLALPFTMNIEGTNHNAKAAYCILC